MKKLFEFKDFDSFVQGINENCTQRNSAISTAVSKLKDEFGDTKEKFLKSAEEKGVDEIKNCLAQILEPYIERIEGQEILQTKEKFALDFDALLSGLASWTLVELEIAQMKKSHKKETK